MVDDEDTDISQCTPCTLAVIAGELYGVCVDEGVPECDCKKQAEAALHARPTEAMKKTRELLTLVKDKAKSVKSKAVIDAAETMLDEIGE